jgi:hypothetical protein
MKELSESMVDGERQDGSSTRSGSEVVVIV